MGHPALASCFWCGASKGHVVMLEQKIEGAGVPLVCVDHNPCPQCQIDMRKKGILLIEVGPTNPTRPRPEVTPGVSPTGRWRSITHEELHAVDLDPSVTIAICRTLTAFLETPIFERFLSEEDRAERREP